MLLFLNLLRPSKLRWREARHDETKISRITKSPRETSLSEKVGVDRASLLVILLKRILAKQNLNKKANTKTEGRSLF